MVQETPTSNLPFILPDELSRLRHQLEVARKALEPFAASWNNSKAHYIGNDNCYASWSSIRNFHLRAAAAAYEAISAGKCKDGE